MPARDFLGRRHTLALLTAGVATITFKLTISPALERALEALVGFVSSCSAARSTVTSTCTWGDHSSHEHVHLSRVGRRPFLVGLLHGMAGSAALMLLVLSTVATPLGGLLYITVFGVGSTAGMLLLSGLIALPFALTADRSTTVSRIIQVAAGAASLGLGLGAGMGSDMRCTPIHFTPCSPRTFLGGGRPVLAPPTFGDMRSRHVSFGQAPVRESC